MLMELGKECTILLTDAQCLYWLPTYVVYHACIATPLV